MSDIPPDQPPPQKLDYGGPSSGTSQIPGTPTYLQAIAGFGSWFGAMAVVAGIIVEGNQLTLPSGVIFFLCVSCVVALAFLAAYTHRRGWTGFLPGLILGMASTCLLVGIICGGLH